MVKKLGRPFLEITRNVKITVRFTENEHKKAKELAKKNNMNLAEYIRHLLEIAENN